MQRNSRADDRALLEGLLNDENSFISTHEARQLLTTDEMKKVGHYGYSIHELKPDSSYSLARNDKKIQKLRLLIPRSPAPASKFPSILYIRYDDGTRESLYVKPEKVKEFHAQINTAYYAHIRMAAPQLDWESKGISPYYTKKTHEYYEKIGKNFSQLIIDQKKNLNVIDLGCGEGGFLIDQIGRIPGLSWIGVDLSADNIQQAREKIREEKNEALKGKEEHFIIGNMLDINTIIEKAFQEKKLDPDKPIIITSLGSITRLVLPDGFVAAKVFQELFRIKNLECILGCGIGEPLITQHIAKRIGFELKIEPPPSNSFSLIKLDEKVILTNKLGKIQKSQILDLSLSPIPETWLTHSVIINTIRETPKPITIDISYCKITEELLASLSNIMRQYRPGEINLIYFDTDAKQVHAFEERFIRYKEHIQTHCVKSSEDILLSGPKRFFDTVNTKDYIKRNISEIYTLFLESKDAVSENNKINQIYKKINAMLSTVSTPALEDFIFELKMDTSNEVLIPVMNLMVAYAHLRTPFSPAICKLIYNYPSSLVGILKTFSDNKQEMPSQMMDYLATHLNTTELHAERIAIFWIELVKHDIKDRETFFKSDFIHDLSNIPAKQLPLYTAAISSCSNMRDLYARLKEQKQSLQEIQKQRLEEKEEDKIYDRNIRDESDSDREESDSDIGSSSLKPKK